MAPLGEDQLTPVDGEVSSAGSATPSRKGEPWDETSEIAHLRSGLAAYRRSESRMAEAVCRLQAQLAERDQCIAELEEELADERRHRKAAEEAAAAAVAAQHEATQQMTEIGADLGPGSAVLAPGAVHALAEQASTAPAGAVGTGPAVSSATADAWDSRSSIVEMEAHLQEFQSLAAAREAHIADTEAQMASLQTLVTAQAARIQELERTLPAQAVPSEENSQAATEAIPSASAAGAVPSAPPCVATAAPLLLQAAADTPLAASGMRTSASATGSAVAASDVAAGAALGAAVAGLLSAAGVVGANGSASPGLPAPGPTAEVRQSPTYAPQSGPSNASVAAIAAAVAEVLKQQQISPDVQADVSHQASPQIEVGPASQGSQRCFKLQASHTAPRLSCPGQLMPPAGLTPPGGTQGGMCSPRLPQPRPAEAACRQQMPTQATSIWQSAPQAAAMASAQAQRGRGVPGGLASAPPPGCEQPAANGRAGSPHPHLGSLRNLPMSVAVPSTAACSTVLSPRGTGQRCNSRAPVGRASPAAPGDRSVSPPQARPLLASPWGTQSAPRLPRVSSGGCNSISWAVQAPAQEEGEHRAPARTGPVPGPVGHVPLPTARPQPLGGGKGSPGSSAVYAPRPPAAPQQPAVPLSRQAQASQLWQPPTPQTQAQPPVQQPQSRQPAHGCPLSQPGQASPSVPLVHL
mmetsp:Transcript_55075/g.171063  ORF Transcript_55075/g.171063 Transcript_55075/m.171063 type:complete len:693 (-) Transcript_55075:123-2201(-)